MQKIFFLLFFALPIIGFGQMSTDDSSTIKIFYSQKAINANTVEVLPKGKMEFRVSHAFGDMGGADGGIRPFFGLESAFDVRIGFQAGLTDKLDVLLARAKGGGAIQQMYELGLKYQFLKQDASGTHPFSLTLFANSVVSSMIANEVPDKEATFAKFSDRTSEVVQLIVAKKFGKVSIQLNPTYLTRGYVRDGDDKNLFSIGGAVRIPITQRFAFIADYFHTFRSQLSKDVFFADPVPIGRPQTKFYDALGVGFEILTAGHVFHLNFTNATEILENRFLANTVKSWGKGGYRWSFTLSRNFTIFHDKKSKVK